MKTPRYWWDFSGNKIIIESDKFPVLAEFSFDDDATDAIEKAENLIADLYAGRTTPKELK